MFMIYTVHNTHTITDLITTNTQIACRLIRMSTASFGLALHSATANTRYQS